MACFESAGASGIAALTTALRNARSVREVLLVNGATPELLYGEDWNLNGRLDPNENDGEPVITLMMPDED